MKNISCILFIVFVLCLPACKQNLPPDIWDKEKMIEFLVDAQLLEAKVSIAELSRKQSDSLYACYYEELFAYHNTTQEIWEKNTEYYRDKPEEMDDIYKEVISRLTLLESTEQHESTKARRHESTKARRHEGTKEKE